MNPLDANDVTIDLTTGITIASGSTATIMVTANSDNAMEGLELMEISIEDPVIESSNPVTADPDVAKIFVYDGGDGK